MGVELKKMPYKHIWESRCHKHIIFGIFDADNNKGD